MYQEQSANEMGMINPYDIYVDVCTSERTHSRSNGIALLKFFANANTEMATYAKTIVKNHMLRAPYDPCQDNYLQEYLNDEAVQVILFNVLIAYSQIRICLIELDLTQLSAIS